MDKFVRNLTIGFAAAAFLMAGSGFDASRAETSGRSVQEAEASSSTTRTDYQTEMEKRFNEAAEDKKELGSDTAEATDDEVSNLEAAWNDVEAGWADVQAAADENWEEAKSALDQAWVDFETAWDETFSDDDTVTQ